MKLPALPPRLKAILLNVSLAAGSLLVAFLVAEIGLRLYQYGGLTAPHSHLPPLIREPDPDTGWRLARDQEAVKSSLDYNLVVRTNSSGLRGPERDIAPDPDQFTIVLLGDSYMEAAHVPEEDGFPRVLEDTLGDGYRVLNFGVGGYSTVQAWRQFVARGKALQPDLVLLAFYAENDIYGNSAELSRRMWGADDARVFSAPFARVRADGTLELQPPEYERAREGFEAMRDRYNPWLKWLDALTDSAVEDRYKRARARFRQKVHEPGDDMRIHLGVYAAEPGTGDPALAAAWDAAYETTAALLHRMQNDVTSADARFAVFTAPSKLQTEAAYWETVEAQVPGMDLARDRPHRWLAERCAESGIPFRDLLPDFREATKNGAELNYTLEDSHWNSAGHAFAAESIAAWLREEGLLENGPS